MRTPTTTARDPGGAQAPGQAPAALGPVPAAVSAAENPAPGPADSPAEAEGRRTLSTAFVRLGAGELLIVELRDGRTIRLRDVVMHRKNFCGVQVLGGGGRQYCGGYGDVEAARPGGGPNPAGLNSAG